MTCIRIDKNKILNFRNVIYFEVIKNIIYFHCVGDKTVFVTYESAEQAIKYSENLEDYVSDYDATRFDET